MADYVLVHGGKVSTETWNKLTKSNEYPEGKYLGGECWKYNVTGLKQHGHQVVAPDLKDENTYNLSDHIDQICSLVLSQDLNNVILVGHSYGGMVITGVASKIPERIKLLVYLDADFPEPGQSLFDILKMGGVDPQNFIDGTPPAYTEKIIYDPDKLKSLSKVYILCTQSEFASVTSLMIQRINFNDTGWIYSELPAGHFAQITMPDELNRILIGFSEAGK